MNNGHVILSAKDVCKSFASNGIQNHVLSNVNLELYQGDFTVIMGSSGSGKSTLLYCLSGMDSVTSGGVFYQGQNIAEYKEKELAGLRRKDFGFIFQQMHLVSNLTVFENIIVPGYLNKEVAALDVMKRATELLSMVNLTEASGRLPSQISGGEQQRAAIARAVISNPLLLFADEPTGALNRKNTTDVLDLLTEMNMQGQGIVLVTHDLYAAVRASRLLYLEDGKIMGEMRMAPFEQDKTRDRETQIQAWLSSMSW